MNKNREKQIFPWVEQGRLSIEVTTHCNIACLHCFARAGISKPSTLPLDLVKGIIAEGYDIGYRRLHLTGGEPLLWKGLWEALDCAFDTGYEVLFMNTNGTLLTEDVSRRLAAYGDLWISVSLEGSEGLHDRLRGEGSFRRTTRGIEKALQAGIGLFIFALVTKSLLPDLPHFVKDLYGRFAGIHGVTLIPITGAVNGHYALSRELLDPEDFLKLVRTVSLLNVYGLRTDVLHEPLVNVASRMLRMPWIPQAEPLYHEGCIIVMANRRIGLSHSSRHRFGKYSPGMLQEVLAFDEYRKAVAPDEAVCSVCKYVGVCRENGMLRPSEYDGNTHPDVPYCVRVLERAGS